MGAYPVLRRFTPEEYLRLERRAETKSEYVDGQIFAMAGGTIDHDVVIVNTMTLLQAQLSGSGKCRAHSADLRIAVSKLGPFFYPDLSVICGEPALTDKSRDCALNPAVVIEVLSKSTRKYDREVKVARYSEIPALRHIVLISQQAIFIEHHFRTPDGTWKTEKLDHLTSTLRLTTPNAALPLAKIYEGLRLHSRA